MSDDGGGFPLPDIRCRYPLACDLPGQPFCWCPGVAELRTAAGCTGPGCAPGAGCPATCSYRPIDPRRPESLEGDQ